jgi:macrolide transport system ATP-binding/permease protein
MRGFDWLKRRGLDEDDFQEEIRAHLEIATEERVADGADPDAARQTSIRDFGNITLAIEAARSVWRPWWLDALRDGLIDVRYAIRVLVKNPAFSLTVIAVLALGIGLNTAVFSLLKSLAVSPLAGVDGSARLGVVLNETRTGRRGGLSYPDYQYLRDHARAFRGLTGSALASVNLGLGSHAQRVVGELVTGNYFQQLGIRAQIGRTLLPSDEVAPGQHPVVVLSDALWRRTFAADPGIVGRTIHLNTMPMTVVGVADAAFHGTIVSFDTGIFAPLMMAPQVGLSMPSAGPDVLDDRDAMFLMVLGRLTHGRTLASAGSEMSLLSSQLRREASATAIERDVKVVPIWQSPYGAQTYMLPAVVAMSAMAALLLLIVCANVAGLVLVRGVARRGELAMRLALGATRRRVLRLLLVENLVLAVPGAAAGLVLVWFGLPLLFSSVSAAAAPGQLFFNFAVDRYVVAFSVLTACASALAFGFVPARRAARIDLLAVINDGLSPRTGASAHVRGILVVSQVAVSMLLLVGSGLVARSLDAARAANAGFDATNVISVGVDLKPSGYDEVRGRAFFNDLLDSIRAAPGVEAATLAATHPMTLVDAGAQRVWVDGYEARPDEDLTFLSNVVAPGYFQTLKIRLIAGREFEAGDDGTTEPVAIVNETLSRRFWGDPMQAIGQRLRHATGGWRTVVGVAADVKYSRINEEARPYVYVPFEQSYRPFMMVHARGPAGIPTLLEQSQARIRALDDDLAILYARSLREQVMTSLTILEIAARMLFALGVAGMALAALGIYGLVSFSVKQSTHEIGVRMALGARGLSVVRGFLVRGLRLGAIGATLGMTAAFAVTRLLDSVLYGVSATDSGSFLRALSVVLAAVVVATLIPVWRGARTNPLTALRRS